MGAELKLRLRELKAELEHATLVAVTKYSPIEDVLEAYTYEQYDFGENRVSDLEAKALVFQKKNLHLVRWHFIGTLQTNKVKELLKVPNLVAIHSVSSLKLVHELIKQQSHYAGPELKLFFQLNTSHEDEKSGFENFNELQESIELVKSLKDSKLKVYGLMTMGAIRTDDFAASALTSFRELKQAREWLQLPELKLSMGMSQDYKIALTESADYIRIGSLIFK